MPSPVIIDETEHITVTVEGDKSPTEIYNDLISRIEDIGYRKPEVRQKCIALLCLIRGTNFVSNKTGPAASLGK